MDGANFVENKMASRGGYVVAKVLSMIRPFLHQASKYWAQKLLHIAVL